MGRDAGRAPARTPLSAARPARESSATAAAAAGGPFTVDAVDGDTRFRVQLEPIEGTSQLLVVAAPLNEADDTLHQLLIVELAVAASVLAAVLLLGLWLVRVGLRPLGRIEHDGCRDRRRRPLAARRERRSAHRGRPARRCAQHDARPDRGGVRRAHGVREPAAPLRRRCVARAAHAARRRARLRGALRPRRPRAPGRSRAVDERHPARVAADGPPGRRPPAARPARPGPAARAQARRARGRRARRRRGGAHARPRPRDRARRAGLGRGAGRPRAAAPDPRQPPRERARAHARRLGGDGARAERWRLPR